MRIKRHKTAKQFSIRLHWNNTVLACKNYI